MMLFLSSPGFVLYLGLTLFLCGLVGGIIYLSRSLVRD